MKAAGHAFAVGRALGRDTRGERRPYSGETSPKRGRCPSPAGRRSPLVPIAVRKAARGEAWRRLLVSSVEQTVPSPAPTSELAGVLSLVKVSRARAPRRSQTGATLTPLPLARSGQLSERGRFMNVTMHKTRGQA
jgi:hypothetical protein